MDRDRQFEDSDLASIVADEIASARAYYGTEVDGKRSLALEYVQGYMRDIKTLPNRSTMVSRDVADTIAWMHPGIIRVFTSSDNVVEYEATKPGSEQWANDATDFMNYDFMRNNQGYRLFYNATWDALTLDMGVVSSEWVDVTTKKKTLKRQTLEQIAMLEEEGVEILTAKALDEFYETEGVDELGFPIVQQMPYYTVKVSRVIKEGHIKDDTLRPENLLINDTATTIEDARAVGYRYDNKTRSDLMEMADVWGFDKDDIRDLPSDGFQSDNSVELSRQMDSAVDYNSPVRSGDIIDLYRYFVMVDVDDDGIAELVHCWYAGSKILAWEVWEDDIPWTDIPCYPVPHRFNGESVADRTMDIQRAKTVLLRQTMDNLYASAIPTQEVEVGSVLNPDALVSKRFGAIIWKKKDSAPIGWGTTPFFADKSLAAMSYFDEVRSMRTGVSRNTMALDPETLQNQTATAAQQQRDAGYSQIELIARNMAELGWSRFFAKRLRLAVKHQQVALIPAPKTNEKFREVNPGEWDDDMGVTINVGLGTGSKDRDMAMLNTLLGTQNTMAQQLGVVPGAQGKALEFIPKIRSTAVKLAESSGLKNPETYFPMVDDQDVEGWKQAAEQQAQQPSPDVVKAQGQIQLEQQKAQLSNQIAQQQQQIDAQSEASRMQFDAMKMEREMELKRYQIDQELLLKREQLNAELILKREQIGAEIALKRELGIMSQSVGTGTSEVGVGGEAG